MLMAAVKRGAIKVCSSEGAIGDAEKLIQASPLPQSFDIEGVPTSEILALHVTSQHLDEWGNATGNSFQVVNVRGTSVEFGPLALQPDGTEAGHYRGYVGGGEQTFYRLIPNAMWKGPNSNDLAAAYSAAIAPTPKADFPEVETICDSTDCPTVKPVEDDAPLKPVQRARAQDAAILGEIRKQGYDPQELPKNDPGKKGVKHLIRAAIGDGGMFTGTTVFNKAWERLTGNSEIVIKG
jgi:hypothetical protein